MIRAIGIVHLGNGERGEAVIGTDHIREVAGDLMAKAID